MKTLKDEKIEISGQLLGVHVTVECIDDSGTVTVITSIDVSGNRVLNYLVRKIRNGR